MSAKPSDCRLYQRRLKKRAFDAIGRACVFCGRKREVHCAHVKRTKLKGPGRGKYHRFADVVKHPDAYRPMCPSCHRTYDALVKLAKPEIVVEAPIPF